VNDRLERSGGVMHGGNTGCGLAFDDDHRDAERPGRLDLGNRSEPPLFLVTSVSMRL